MKNGVSVKDPTLDDKKKYLLKRRKTSQQNRQFHILIFHQTPTLHP
jgi:hypothetical protein